MNAEVEMKMEDMHLEFYAEFKAALHGLWGLDPDDSPSNYYSDEVLANMLAIYQRGRQAGEATGYITARNAAQPAEIDRLREALSRLAMIVATEDESAAVLWARVNYMASVAEAALAHGRVPRSELHGDLSPRTPQ